MENLIKDFITLIKSPNDSITQLKSITILNEILDKIKKLEKKKLTEIQTQIEDMLYSYIISNRANSDISYRYIYYNYKYKFDFGLKKSY